ncbi:MAG: excinuclease ABC subunit UvrA [Candidatus Pacebacteria bacterium]|nr:excinuclease ABC subunit UvrA [Candidatus Paceibacterota bacterium]
MNDKIIIKGARVNNLKDVDLELPKNKLIVFSGLSGSGKSSLAFETIFAEGQRRYVESLSPYARQFLGQMEKPDVDEITGLSPAIAIDQKAHSHNPRSTVATLTEIYDYLRVLYARIGKPFCPECGREIKKMSVEEMVESIQKHAKKTGSEYVTIVAPIVRGRKGEYFQLLQDLFQQGFSEARIDGRKVSLRERVELKRYGAHNIDVVIDKVFLMEDEKTGLSAGQSRLYEAVETALDKGKGLVAATFGDKKQDDKDEEVLFSAHWTCPNDGFAFPEIEPRLFSFNSPYGACEACHGIGHDFFDETKVCPSCKGARLKNEVLSIKLHGKNINEVVSLTIDKAYEFFIEFEDRLSENEKLIAKNVLKEISSRLEFLLEVGLEYLSLGRESGTLSGGEAQRIRLASQIGSKLSGTLYVLDEPTIGLHERDNERLLKILKHLRDYGNTLIVVEHDERVLQDSDYFVDIGPGPGIHGGKIVKAGILKELGNKNKDSGSLTIDYLTGRRKIEVPAARRSKEKGSIKIIGATANNIKNLNVEIPLGRFVCITGVSGSGKSTLMENIFCKNVQKRIGGFSNIEGISKITGTEYVRRIIEVDQSPIGKSPRSNPATYTGVFTPIRNLYEMLPEAKERAYKSGRFSFNVPSSRGGGRCEACEGAGVKIIEMHFLPDVLVKCDVCRGKRFNKETLEVKYKGKSIADVLDMTVEEAHDLFSDIYQINDTLKVLKDVGLGYIKLGQSATTLSGGEAQRIKLSKELARPTMRNAVFVLDEPTTGLHFEDVKMLLEVIQKLIEKGNTVILIEHNMHVIKTADYIIDMGPEGGSGGGKIIAKGTPEEVAKVKESYTGKYLKKYL